LLNSVFIIFTKTGALGVEPRSTAPKAGVLPLHYAPNLRYSLNIERIRAA
jgi:hypothetical protein